MDSVYSHANWGRDLGGVSFPLLADFEPKGAVAGAFGHYLADNGITDRATVIIDAEGTIRYSESVTPAGQRNIEELISKCEEINGGSNAAASSSSVPAGTVLYVKSNCGHSRAALLAVDNLGLQDDIEVRNVTEDAAAAADLERQGGANQAPCLVIDGKPMYESADIVADLAGRVAPV